MNSRAILAEPLFLIVVAVIGTSMLSAATQIATNNATSQPQTYYHLTTQWQNLRFILEQETVNQIVDTINSPLNNCAYTPTPIDYQTFINNNFNNSQINCSAPSVTPSWTGGIATFSFILACTYSANGSMASFSQSVSFSKQISASGTPPSCNITIIDTQSGLADVGSAPSGKTCSISLSDNSIEVGESTTVTLNAIGFAPAIGPVACQDGADYTNNPGCAGSNCIGTCGAYTQSGEFIISGSLLDGTEPIDCGFAPISVTGPPDGAIAYWRFEDAVGSSTFADGTGNYPLTNNNATLDSGIVESQSLSVTNDGSWINHSYAFVPQSRGLSIPSTFSISFWVKEINFAGKTVFSHCKQDAANQCLHIQVQGSTIKVSFSNTNDELVALNAVPNNFWTHVAVTYDNALPQNKRKIFVNGFLVASDNPSGFTGIQPATKTCLGTFCDSSGNPDFGFQSTVNLDQFTIWNKALNESEVLNLVKEGALVLEGDAEWKFEQEETGRYFNEVSRTYDLLNFGLEEAFGKDEKGILVNQSDSESQEDKLAYSPFINLSKTSFTITAWINQISGSNNNEIFSQHLSDNGGKGIRLFSRTGSWGDNILTFRLEGANPTELSYVGTASGEHWNHVAFRYTYNSGTNMGTREIFLDGQRVKWDSSPQSNPPNMGFFPACIGIYCPNPNIFIPNSLFNRFKGKMDNFRIYHSALDNTTIYQQAQEAPHSFSTDPQIPLAQWRFETEENDFYLDSTINDAKLYALGTSLDSEPGISGNALLLNNQFGITPLEIPLGGRSFSITAWYKPIELFSPFQNKTIIFSQCSDPYITNSCIAIENNWENLNATGNRWNWFGVPTYVPVLHDNAWNQIGLTYDSTTDELKLYFNGQFINSGNYPDFNPPSTPVLLGKLREFDWEGWLSIPAKKGAFDEVTIWNRELTLNEIREQFNSLRNPRLLKRYKFSENQGVFFKDEVSGQNDLYTSNVTKITGDSCANAVEFNGSSSFARGPVLDLAGQSYSVSMWIKPTGSIDGLRNLFTNCYLKDRDNRCLELQFDQIVDGDWDALIFESWGYYNRANNQAINNDSWYHLVFVNDFTDPLNIKRKIFVNGINRLDEQSLGKAFEGAAAQFCLGAKCYNYYWDDSLNPPRFVQDNYQQKSNYFNGRMADVRIYNQALSQEEITGLYSNGNGCNLP